MDDIETGDYNNDTNINDLKKNIRDTTIGQKKSSKNRNLSRKKPYSRSNKETLEDVLFLKQVPVHPKDRLAKKTKDEVKFVK